MKRNFALAILLMGLLTVNAKVRLPHVIGNDMVLQQNTEARLWGWAKPGKKVKVTPSWDNNTYSATTDKEGHWLVKVHTPAAGFTPYSITFDDGDKLTITGVVSGEVWECAGQSNMEMPVKGFGRGRCRQLARCTLREDSQCDVDDPARRCRL